MNSRYTSVLYPFFAVVLWLFCMQSGWLSLAFHGRCALLPRSKMVLAILSWVILSDFIRKGMGLAKFLMFEVISRKASRIPPL